MNHERSPSLPRKPAEYEHLPPNQSLTEILCSLNIDEDDAWDTRGAHGANQHLDNRRQSRLAFPQSEVPLSTVDHQRVQGRAPDSQSQGQLRSAGNPDVYGARPATSKVIAEQRIGPGPEKKRPARKPVDTTPPRRRTYFSPDDLDDLLLEQNSSETRPHGSVTHVQPQIQADSPGMSLPSHDKHLTNDLHTPKPNQYLGRQSAHGLSLDYGVNQQLPTPAGMQQSRIASVYHADNNRTLQNIQARAMDDRDMRDKSSDSLSRSLRHTGPYTQIPSPPLRRDSAPSPPSHRNSYLAPELFEVHPTYLPALQPNYDLAHHASVTSRIQHTSRSPSRVDGVPNRSQSALSNHSYHSHLSHPSTGRQSPYAYYKIDQEQSHGGRLSSPDHSQQFLDASADLVNREGSASIPPISQARRGRQKGEVVAESDLPAMPLLFSTSDSSQNTKQDARPQTSHPSTYSPSRSPTRNSHVPPQAWSGKRQLREPDPLQSIKLLPVTPIRCPPLCLEERFHPSSFVKTSKLKVKVYPHSMPFVAGGEVFGHMDIISDEGIRAQIGSTQVLIGEIGVEIIGYEEIQHTDSGHNPRSFTFLYSRKICQSLAETHPGRAARGQVLTSSVLFNPPPDQDGYRSACKGTSSFPFSFALPVDAPSSVDLQTARVKYLVTGYATVKLQGSQETIATTVPVRVVEAWDIDNPIYEEPIEAVHGRDIANYHEIAATAKIARSLYLEGETILGNIRVVNHSSRKIREVKFLLMNTINLFGDQRSSDKDLNPRDDFSLDETAMGHVEPHIILKGAEETWNFNIQIPTERCISVRNTALFEVTPTLLIKISTGPLQKSVRLSMPPICIANPHSMVDDIDKRAPTSEVMRWSNLPNLYRFQHIVDGQLQAPEKGVLEVTELITYVTAQDRVFLLSST